MDLRRKSNYRLYGFAGSQRSHGWRLEFRWQIGDALQYRGVPLEASFWDCLLQFNEPQIDIASW
jgi:hypothetical protein